MLDCLRIVSGWACILAGLVFAGGAALAMVVTITTSNGAGLLLVIIFTVPAMLYFALASYAMRKAPTERDEPF